MVFSGETMDLDPNKTYVYHTVYDIQPTNFYLHVDLNMNRKKNTKYCFG